MIIIQDEVYKSLFRITQVHRQELSLIARALDVYRNYCFEVEAELEEEDDKYRYRRDKKESADLHMQIINIISKEV